jgi:hypothetical protein
MVILLSIARLNQSIKVLNKVKGCHFENSYEGYRFNQFVLAVEEHLQPYQKLLRDCYSNGCAEDDEFHKYMMPTLLHEVEIEIDKKFSFLDMNNIDDLTTDDIDYLINKIKIFESPVIQQ